MTSTSTNKAQMTMLVKFMEKNPDISMGMTNIKHSKERWEKFTIALNSRGPPMKSWEQWNRVWINFKAKTKRKVSERRAEYMATGADPNALLNNRLTPLESCVESFLTFNESVDLSRQEYGLVVPEVANEAEGIDLKEEKPSQSESGGNEFSATVNKRKRALKRKTKTKNLEEDSRMALLERQVNNQSKFHKEISDKFETLDNTLKKFITIKEGEIKILKKK